MCQLSQNQDNQIFTLKLTNCNCFYSKFEGGRRVSVKFLNAEIVLTQHSDRNSILLHSGLNPAWHFWLSTRFSCCLKMKSVENILGHNREQFYRFSRNVKICNLFAISHFTIIEDITVECRLYFHIMFLWAITTFH